MSFSSPPRPAKRRGAFSLFLAGLTAALGACTESATQPEPGPPPPADTATYDLIFEQSSFPLNASHLRIRRHGETSDGLLYDRDLVGIEPTVSADGRVLAFQGYGDMAGDDSDLWVIRSGGAATRVPLPVGDTEYAPSLSPDGTRMAYVRLGEDGNTQLWVTSLDGTARLLLSANLPTSAAGNASPDWSPDGTRLAWATGAPGALRITVVKADGTGRQTVSAGVAGGSDIDVDWSPDGKQLVFVRTPSPAQGQLVVLTLATGAERVLGPINRVRHPAWAPDGQSIVFASTMDSEDGDYDLFSIPTNGGVLTRLTNDALNQRHPVWVRRPSP